MFCALPSCVGHCNRASLVVMKKILEIAAGVLVLVIIGFAFGRFAAIGVGHSGGLVRSVVPEGEDVMVAVPVVEQAESEQFTEEPIDPDCVSEGEQVVVPDKCLQVR